jgi:tetratricopeptide (TPR) repeat protein
MREEHLTAEGLERLLEEDSSPEHNRLLLHHLAICPACYAVAGYILDLYEAGALPLTFCTVDIDLARSRAEAPALYEALRRYSFGEQQSLIRDIPRFRSWGLCELLCRESEAAGPHDARQAVELAELAVAVGRSLEEWQPVEHTWLCQLRALAYAHLGNALRVKGLLRSAAQSFVEAERWWEAGADAGNALDYEAQILAMKASLRHAERQLPEALDLLERAEEAEPTPSLRTIILINKSRVLEEAGRFGEAMATLDVAATRVEQETNPRLLLCIRQNRLWLLTTLERFEEAAENLPEVKGLSSNLAGALDLVRLRWAEARIAAGLGESRLGIAIFDEVRQAFLSAGVDYDAALVSLELAALYAAEGSTQEVKTLAAELLPVFQSQNVHREALAALGLFVQAAIDEMATAELAGRILAYLRQARFNPSVPFDAQG